MKTCGLDVHKDNIFCALTMEKNTRKKKGKYLGTITQKVCFLILYYFYHSLPCYHDIHALCLQADIRFVGGGDALVY